MSIAYNGNEPYIFISYSHKDAPAVLRAVEVLNNNGFRVWYDNGIEAGTEWPEYIAERMMNCCVAIAFMSRNSQESHNCRREIHFAIELKKELLVVYLEEFDLSPGMRLQLSALQAMYKHKFKTENEFLSHLCGASIIRRCKAEHINIAHENERVFPQPQTDRAVPREQIAPKQYDTAMQTQNSAPTVVKSSRQAVIEAVRVCNTALKAQKFAFFFKNPSELSQRQMENAISVIAKNQISRTDIISVMDDTLFSSAKSGYVVTENRFFCAGLTLATFDFSLTELRGVSSPSGSHLLLKFADGSERDLFFNNYFRCFEAFFSTYIQQMGY